MLLADFRLSISGLKLKLAVTLIDYTQLSLSWLDKEGNESKKENVCISPFL